MALPFEIDLDEIDAFFKEIAPELGDSWKERKDLYEDEGMRTGRQHENHILGILLGLDLINNPLLTTTDIEKYYKIFFKKIARSTVSTYLNQLDKEGVLAKERKGRIVYYFIEEKPPFNINPFWTVRNFCILPIYFIRVYYMLRFYKDVKASTPEYERFQKFIIGLIILSLLRNRFNKCVLCQFGDRAAYKELRNTYNIILKDRMDVLPDRLQKFINDLGEIPLFGGIMIPSEEYPDEKIKKDIEDLVVMYAQDIDFQMNVSRRRQELRIKQLHEKGEPLKNKEKE